MAATILLTGATGYIGGRLLAEFERLGLPVRCLARHPEALRPRVAASTDVVRGDVLDQASLREALAGVEVAYYLVHSMGARSAFADLDREGARRFGEAAREAGVRRIVYLGGLGDAGDNLSAHLRSRHETGEVLRESGVEVVEFRASIVIGPGSLSYEMVRALTERLPVMVCPRWVGIETQPIAVEDVLTYLVAALDLPGGPSQTYEIGGPDVVSYGDIMREYARQRGLRRLMIAVPLLTPRLSSLWLALVTPLYARVGRKLIASIRNATVVRDRRALDVFPVRPRGLVDAIARALDTAESRTGNGRVTDARRNDINPRHASAPPCRSRSRASGTKPRAPQGVAVMRTLFVAALAFTVVTAAATGLRASEPQAKDIVDTAVAAGNFKTLAKALEAAGLIETLKGTGPFTVFAPTDQAFAKLPAGTLDGLLKDKAKLTAVLTYHVVPGKVMAADVAKLKDAKTVQGQSIKIDTTAGVKVDGANVIKTDIVASNGVIHVIDAVILPAAGAAR